LARAALPRRDALAAVPSRAQPVGLAHRHLPELSPEGGAEPARPRPLRETLDPVIEFERIAENVADEASPLHSVSVVPRLVGRRRAAECTADPAIALGAERVIVIGLNSSVIPRVPPLTAKPDLFDGAASGPSCASPNPSLFGRILDAARNPMMASLTATCSWGGSSWTS